jgi:hypothetical protein
VASIAEMGFGRSGPCIGESRGYGKAAIRDRVRQTLRFLKGRLPNERGFFYHFIDIETGERVWNCELSSIDTSLLLCGVLTARQHFNDPEIQDFATAIYARGLAVGAQWRRNVLHGTEAGQRLLALALGTYCELMMIYRLAIGSPRHSVPSETWKAWAWTRPTVKFQEFEYISGNDPLFTHQYSQAWFDFRHKRDAYADYFANSLQRPKRISGFVFLCAMSFPITARIFGESLPPIRQRAIRLGVVLRRWGDWTAASSRALRADRCHYSRKIACWCCGRSANVIRKLGDDMGSSTHSIL